MRQVLPCNRNRIGNGSDAMRESVLAKIKNLDSSTASQL